MTLLKNIYDIYLGNPDICTDSRDIRKGCLFFALKGENFDGNIYSGEALDKGASFAIIDNPAFAVTNHHILVPDVLECLQELAAHHRSKLDARIIGVTGTNGKTTTKELISRVLATTFKTSATKGNLNNQIGVPLTLLSMDAKTEFAVVEMGANHPGEIAALCRIAQPGFGLVTNIGKAHLEGFGSLQGVIRTKSELYDHLRHNHGVAFLNIDNPLLVRQSKSLSLVRYGKKAGASCRGRIKAQSPFLELSWKCENDWVDIQTSLYGAYNFENILAALCVGDYFKVEKEAIINAVSAYVPDNNRSQVKRTEKNNTLILDAYNANPTSMASAIRSFSSVPGTNKMLILGDMLELGGKSENEHKIIISLIEELGFNEVILVGEIFSTLPVPGNWLKFRDTEAVKEHFRTNRLNGFSILVKGSRRIKLESLVEML
jgi:UDP-N-acetylmuramoyl-tripeptide--D-alanyl-D-alanine ligase